MAPTWAGPGLFDLFVSCFEVSTHKDRMEKIDDLATPWVTRVILKVSTSFWSEHRQSI